MPQFSPLIADPRPTSTSPYFQTGGAPGTSDIGRQLGDPSAFRAPIETRNELTRLLFDALGSPTSGAPYSSSPGRGRADQTLAALLGMGSRQGETAGGYGPSQQGAIASDTQKLGPETQGALSIQEVQRLGPLLQLLVGDYLQTGQLSSLPTAIENQLRNIITQYHQQRAALVGQTPIIGPILAGTGFGG